MEKNLKQANVEEVKSAAAASHIQESEDRPLKAAQEPKKSRKRNKRKNAKVNDIEEKKYDDDDDMQLQDAIIEEDKE